MITFQDQIEELLTKIIACNQLHSKWINTLSFLENCGARKIASCEHPTLVKEEMLKHAAEEFRHAHYLKRQIQRVSADTLETYALSSMLGGYATLHYINALNVKAARYLKMHGVPRHADYVLVTYAIELRAAVLYPIYDALLRKARSPITVKSILLEENEHLAEMKEKLTRLPSGFIHAEQISLIENDLCKDWLDSVDKQSS